MGGGGGGGEEKKLQPLLVHAPEVFFVEST